MEKSRRTEVDAGHDGRENSVAAVLANDGERRTEGGESTDGKTRTVQEGKVRVGRYG
jgi:hypothetical protein